MAMARECGVLSFSLLFGLLFTEIQSKLVRIEDTRNVTLRWTVPADMTSSARFIYTYSRWNANLAELYDQDFCVPNREITQIVAKTCAHDTKRHVATLVADVSAYGDRVTQGVFQCRPLGQQSPLENITLFIYKPPTDPVITADVYNDSANPQVYLRFRCKSSSTSVPAEHRQPIQYMWYIGDNIVSSNNSDRRVISGDFGETLTIFPAFHGDCLDVIKCSVAESGSNLTSTTSFICNYTTVLPEQVDILKSTSQQDDVTVTLEGTRDAGLDTSGESVLQVVLPVVVVVILAVVATNVIVCIWWKRKKARQSEAEDKKYSVISAPTRIGSDLYELAPDVEHMKANSIKFKPRSKDDEFPPLPDMPGKLAVVEDNVKYLTLRSEHTDDAGYQIPVTKEVYDNLTGKSKDNAAPEDTTIHIVQEYMCTSGLKMTAEEVDSQYLTTTDVSEREPITGKSATGNGCGHPPATPLSPEQIANKGPTLAAPCTGGVQLRMKSGSKTLPSLKNGVSLTITETPHKF